MFIIILASSNNGNGCSAKITKYYARIVNNAKIPWISRFQYISVLTTLLNCSVHTQSVAVDMLPGSSSMRYFLRHLKKRDCAKDASLLTKSKIIISTITCKPPYNPQFKLSVLHWYQQKNYHSSHTAKSSVSIKRAKFCMWSWASLPPLQPKEQLKCKKETWIPDLSDGESNPGLPRIAELTSGNHDR